MIITCSASIKMDQIHFQWICSKRPVALSIADCDLIARIRTFGKCPSTKTCESPKEESGSSKKPIVKLWLHPWCIQSGSWLSWLLFCENSFKGAQVQNSQQWRCPTITISLNENRFPWRRPKILRLQSGYRLINAMVRTQPKRVAPCQE